MMHQVRTTISLDEDVLLRAKAVAGASHRTLSAVVNDAVQIHLALLSDNVESGEISLPTFGHGGLVDGVDLDDGDAIARLLGDEELPRVDA